jgi:alkanesulfonate monooxygenase SsuD/methylene tetrahydromethanopterin reductase-like flavin-dependent oxidoreductase (luciferase family)
MKFICFDLMPYRGLDFAEREKHRSAWVVLPNSLYDPKRGADDYEGHIDNLVYAEELGFDGISVNEHHQTAYGLMPAPNIIAAMLIARTKRVKICVLGRALPITENPLTIAEEFAMLDNLSRGRLITGFVRGIGTEYHATGINPYFSHERFHEAHDLIVAAWTREGPFAFEGEHYNFRYVNTWPRPYQQPHPPIWIPSQGSGETIEWAADPARKYPMLITFAAQDLVARYHLEYREQTRRFGYEASGDQLGWAVPIYVADTDESAKAEAGAAIESLFNTYLPNPWEMLVPPGYTSIASTKKIQQMRKAIGTRKRDQTVDELVANGTAIIGSRKTVIERIEAMREKTGFNILVGMFQFGTLSDALARRNMERFASDIMPRFRDLTVENRPPSLVDA